MKILLLNLLLNLPTTADALPKDDYQDIREVLDSEISVVSLYESFESTLKIFDTEGNLIQEIKKAAYMDNTMSQDEYHIVANSHFMFNYLNNDYFLYEE